MTAQWYCRIDDVPYGPLTSQQLQVMAKRGKLSATDYLRKGNAGKWLRAKLVKGLCFPSLNNGNTTAETNLINDGKSATGVAPNRVQNPCMVAGTSDSESWLKSSQFYVVLASAAVFLAAVAALSLLVVNEKGTVSMRSDKLTFAPINVAPIDDPTTQIPARASGSDPNDATTPPADKSPETRDDGKVGPNEKKNVPAAEATTPQFAKFEIKKNKKNIGVRQIKRQRRFAVVRTPGLKNYDSIESLLQSLGKGYHYDKLQDHDLLNFNRIGKYDVLFLPCGGHLVNHRIRDNLREFVKQGGTIYASDLRFKQIAQAFKEYVKPSAVDEGRRAQLAVDIADPELQQLFGRKLLGLRFDMVAWRPAAFDKSKVDVLLGGMYPNLGGRRRYGFFLVRFKHGKGTVIFTSFHNGAQRDGTERKLLRHLVVTTVTAKIETFINQTIISGGFRPIKTNRIGFLPGIRTVTHKFNNTKKCQLRFDLGILDPGANLKLTLNSPTGKKYEKIGTTSFNITIPIAETGEWRYAVAALQTPYDNFPFTITIGQSEVGQPGDRSTAPAVK